ncbi:lipopolysaccharide biosynthesis protein [Pseudomonas cavernae]|uniref:Lipopolysaccharide biosynthesis protein n=1 Tax=Pseudomonas cavernae TaxID=2320867 RepID=A0A385YX42_9PSED|nr:oligosaccharide flippase family protein [Pseudomonas cavernae]AYC31459.1 lipopolysaccharide biosynthesis protein [Pseudomonas cavernae]
MSLKAKFQQTTQNGFIRSVSVLVSGTAFAQALMVLVLPILTRLYTPEDFSVLAVYAALLGIISVAACLRLDVAIPMPQKDEDAANLFALALSFTIITASITTLVVLFLSTEFMVEVGLEALLPYIWMLPAGILFAGSYSSLQFWATRKKAFPFVAKTRMTQATAAATSQVGLGWFGLTPFGLLFGQMLSSGSGVLGLGKRMWMEDRSVLRAISIAEMRHLLHEYRRFPQYSTFESLANSAAIQLPVIIIASLAIGPEAGFLMLAMRVMQAPMGLIGGAIAQVYLSRAPEEFRKGNLGPFTATIFGGLLKTGVGPLVFAGIVAPDVFALIFGEEWRRAGVLVMWMTPWFIMQFLSSPISMALHVTNNQRTALYLQAFGLALRVGFVFAAAEFSRSNISEVYAVSGLIFYCAYIVFIIRSIKCSLSDCLKESKSGIPYVLAWVAFGLLASFIFEVINFP